MADEETAVQPGPVRVDADRFDRPFVFLDARFAVMLSAADTNGAACAIDTNRFARGGPPLHVHAAQDEWFLVREGAFDIRVGAVTHRLTAGDSLLAPRGVPHAFANVTETGRMLVAFFPAGSMEAFFREASGIEDPTPPRMAAVFAAHGMQVIGPPLPTRD